MVSHPQPDKTYLPSEHISKRVILKSLRPIGLFYWLKGLIWALTDTQIGLPDDLWHGNKSFWAVMIFGKYDELVDHSLLKLISCLGWSRAHGTYSIFKFNFEGWSTCVSTFKIYLLKNFTEKSMSHSLLKANDEFQNTTNLTTL